MLIFNCEAEPLPDSPRNCSSIDASCWANGSVDSAAFAELAGSDSVRFASGFAWVVWLVEVIIVFVPAPFSSHVVRHFRGGGRLVAGGSLVKVFRFLNRQVRKPAPFELGPLEFAVMEIVWRRGESSVRHVAELLARPLAYTTVMTTLDRLYKKGLLHRRKSERAFVYRAALSREEWERKQAGDAVAGLLDARYSSEMLISCLVDAVERHDQSLLDELERKIRSRRESAGRKS